MKKYIFALTAVAAIFSSCSKDEVLENAEPQGITTITASTLQESGTNAYVDNNDIKWAAGDQLSVFGSFGDDAPVAYTLDSYYDNCYSGKFTNTTNPVTEVKAIMYPYQDGARCNEEQGSSYIDYNIPTVQVGVTGSFDKSAAIMCNLNGGTNISLRVNFLKVYLGDSNVHSVTISSETSQLSGRVRYNGSTYSSPSDDEKVNSVTLIADPDNTSSCFKAGTYYIAVKPGDIVKPTISYVKIFPNDHEAEEWYKPSSGTISFTGNVKEIGVDWGRNPNKRIAVQLWENGPYFAEYNVGAISVTDPGSYFTWGGIKAYCEENGWDGAYISNGDVRSLPMGRDAAVYQWGSAWRTPSEVDFDNLVDKCTYAFNNYSITISGKEGYALKSIKLPPTSIYVEGSKQKNSGVLYSNAGKYLSSDNDSGGSGGRCSCLYFDQGFGTFESGYANRAWAIPLRAVLR